MSEYQYSVYWQGTESAEPGPALDEDAECDVCIVGGGFTGMWTAHFLKLADPDLKVRIVEAGLAGGGASGTADGFVTPTIGKDLEGVIDAHGVRSAAAACDAVGRSILEIGRFLRRRKVDADYEANDYLMVAVTEAQVARMRRSAALSAQLGSRFEMRVMDADEARKRIDSHAVLAAIRTGGALVNPFKLARGLHRVITEQGVVVHEQTAARVVERSGDVYRVRTDGGTLTAPRVVLATSAYQHRLPGFGKKVIPVWSYAMVSEPLTGAQLERVNWPGREGLVEAKTFLNCGRFTVDNRILWAGGTPRYYYGRDMRPDRMRNPAAFRELRASFARYFPEWRDVRFSHAYGGCVDVTRDFVPHFGAVSPGLYYGYGYCGNGIAATHMGGKVLRDLVLGEKTEYTGLPFVDGQEPSFPPEPLLFPGVRGASRLIEWRESRA